MSKSEMERVFEDFRVAMMNAMDSCRIAMEEINTLRREHQLETKKIEEFSRKIKEITEGLHGKNGQI